MGPPSRGNNATMVSAGHDGTLNTYSHGDDSGLEVREVNNATGSKKHNDAVSVTQWGGAFFRPGAAPEVERVRAEPIFGDSEQKKKALSSPPTSLSEVNFALRSAARQAQ